MVDFGDVEAGTDYLYKYALQIAVTAPAAFHLYAAAADFTGTATLSTAQRLYWLASSNQNTSFGSPSVPFGSSMESIYAGKKNTALGYDYILRLGNSDSPGVYSANVTYTVVAQ